MTEEADDPQELSDDEKIATLSLLIEKHLPSTVRPMLNAEYCYSHWYAQVLVRQHKHPLIAFGLGPASEDWKRVRKAATELKRALIALGPDGAKEATWKAPDWWDRKFPLPNEGFVIASVIEDAAAEMETVRKGMKKAGKKRNWKAAAIAKSTRNIWAQASWEGPVFNMETDNKEVNQLAYVPGYSDHLERYAPRVVHHDTLGPFGSFLQDILDFFDCGVAAGSALRSLKQAEDALDDISRKLSKT